MKKRGLFCNKRGIEHQQLVLLTELFLPAIIMLILLFWVHDVTTTKGFDKNYIARDTALLESSLYASPGNIFYLYYVDGEYGFNFEKYEANIALEGDKFPVRYPYRKNDNIILGEFAVPYPASSFYSMKIGREFNTEKDMDSEINEIVCPTVSTAKIESLGLDPIDEDKTFSIAKSLVTNLAIEIPNTIITRDEDVDRNPDDLASSESIIGIRFGSYQADKNYAKACYSLTSSKSVESKKLGCLILNQIFDDSEFDGMAVIGINPSIYGEDLQEKILDTNKLGVLLEIGNTNNAEGIKLLEKTSKIAKSITTGLKQYDE